MAKLGLYLLCMAATFYMAVIYNSGGLLILGGVEFLLPPFFLCLLLYVRRQMMIQILVPVTVANQKGDYPITVQVENKSRFSIYHLRTKVIMKNTMTKEKRVLRIKGDVKANTTEDLEWVMHNPGLGLWSVECRSIRCYDWFGIFHVKKRVREQKKMMILPACYETNVKAGIRTRLFLSDGMLYHPQLNGDDPTEILNIREYQNGDSLNKIHWKLSAKNDTLIVKELSMPLGCNVVFFLNAEVKQMKRKEQQVYWEVVYTISSGLLEQECFHYIAWYDKKEQKMCRKAIMNEEDIYDFWGEILLFSLGSGAPKEEYQREFKGDTYASQIIFKQNLELYCNDKFLTKFEPPKVKEQLLEMEITV